MSPTYPRLALGLAIALSGATSASAQSGGSAAPKLTDPEIAHIAVTANAIDVEAGELASGTARSEGVRRFAKTMITDHTMVNERAAALAKRLGVTPADNAVSRSLLDGAAEAKGRLQGLRGEAFDRAYLDREVAYHEAVLNALDQLLIPSTSNAELRTLLQEVRPAVAAHLAHARSLRDSLASGR